MLNFSIRLTLPWQAQTLTQLLAAMSDLKGKNAIVTGGGKVSHSRQDRSPMKRFLLPSIPRPPLTPEPRSLDRRDAGQAGCQRCHPLQLGVLQG